MVNFLHAIGPNLAVEGKLENFCGGIGLKSNYSSRSCTTPIKGFNLTCLNCLPPKFCLRQQIYFGLKLAEI